jgi:hypothetical protein
VFRLSLKFYGLSSTSVERHASRPDQRLGTEAHIVAASPKFSDGTGLEPAVTEKSRPVGSPGGLFLFSQAAPTHTRLYGVVDG